jgi:hypothetical protein
MQFLVEIPRFERLLPFLLAGLYHNRGAGCCLFHIQFQPCCSGIGEVARVFRPFIPAVEGYWWGP